jgi:hypothetical protein
MPKPVHLWAGEAQDAMTYHPDADSHP